MAEQAMPGIFLCNQLLLQVTVQNMTILVPLCIYNKNNPYGMRGYMFK